MTKYLVTLALALVSELSAAQGYEANNPPTDAGIVVICLIAAVTIPYVCYLLARIVFLELRIQRNAAAGRRTRLANRMESFNGCVRPLPTRTK